MAALGCDEKPRPALGDSARPGTTPSESSAKPKPAGPPDFAIDTLGAKVGYERAPLDKADGKSTLRELLASASEFVAGKDVSLHVDRSVKRPWVAAYIAELGKLGATHVIVGSETRKEFAPTLPFTPERSLTSPAPCSVVAMVLEDRGTAVWKLSGGVATKHGKGMAGPDLSMTGDNIERFAKGCKQSRTLFVSAGPSVEWGLAYDLAASAKALEKAPFDAFVLLDVTPVPGHPVELRL